MIPYDCKISSISINSGFDQTVLNSKDFLDHEFNFVVYCVRAESDTQYQYLLKDNRSGVLTGLFLHR